MSLSAGRGGITSNNTDELIDGSWLHLLDRTRRVAGEDAAHAHIAWLRGPRRAVGTKQNLNEVNRKEKSLR